MSLVNPKVKMSKSEANLRSRVLLGDSLETIQTKIRRAVTDSDGENINFDPTNRPGLSNLIQIYSAFTSQEVEDVCRQFNQDKVNISKFKELLSSSIYQKLKDIQENKARITDQDIKGILAEGTRKARKEAD